MKRWRKGFSRGIKRFPRSERIMGNRIRQSILVLSLCLPGVEVYGEIYRYTDSKGEVHCVDDISRVPNQYRSQSKDAQSLPEVNVVGSPGAASRDALSTTNSQPADQLQRNTMRYNGTVEIFVTSWCGYCKQLEKFLDSQGIRYRAYDIEKDRDANNVYKELGGRGVPLTRVGSSVVRGYNPAAILRAVTNE
jgi:glutaredoxin